MRGPSGDAAVRQFSLAGGGVGVRASQYLKDGVASGRHGVHLGCVHGSIDETLVEQRHGLGGALDVLFLQLLDEDA